MKYIVGFTNGVIIGIEVAEPETFVRTIRHAMQSQPDAEWHAGDDVIFDMRQVIFAMPSKSGIVLRPTE